jgi:hypothetical protein
MNKTPSTMKNHGSLLKYKNSATSERTQEKWAPVSTNAGTLPTLNSSITHNGESKDAALILCKLLKSFAQGLTDLRAAARFPTA